MHKKLLLIVSVISIMLLVGCRTPLPQFGAQPTPTAAPTLEDLNKPQNTDPTDLTNVISAQDGQSK